MPCTAVELAPARPPGRRPPRPGPPCPCQVAIEEDGVREKILALEKKYADTPKVEPGGKACFLGLLVAEWPTSSSVLLRNPCWWLSAALSPPPAFSLPAPLLHAQWPCPPAGSAQQTRGSHHTCSTTICAPGPLPRRRASRTPTLAAGGPATTTARSASRPGPWTTSTPTRVGGTGGWALQGAGGAARTAERGSRPSELPRWHSECMASRVVCVGVEGCHPVVLPE